MPPKNDTRAVIFCRLTAEERSQSLLIRDDDCRQTTTNAPEASHHPETTSGIVDSNIVVGDDPHSNWADALGSRAPRRAVVPAPKRQQREFKFEAKKDTGRHPSKSMKSPIHKPLINRKNLSKKYLAKKSLIRTSLLKSLIKKLLIQKSLLEKKPPIKMPINTEDNETDDPEIVYIFTKRQRNPPHTPQVIPSIPTAASLPASEMSQRQQTAALDNIKNSLKSKDRRPSSNLPRLLSDLPGWPKHRKGSNKLKNQLRERKAMAERAVEIYMAREEARSAALP